ncbi:MAG: chromosomal replication initiator protein DnaA [Candidatus Gastranaerophilales bacterium]
MDMQKVKNIWCEIKAELRVSIPTPAFQMWVEPLEAVEFEGNMFSILSVHALGPQVIKTNYDTQIVEAFQKVLGKSVGYNITYDDELAKLYQKEKKKEFTRLKNSPTGTVETLASDNLAQMQSSANLNLKYKFANFVVGENCRFAHAAAFSVAQSPAKKYNPLFIYGASGLGKTHLMQAIGHHVVFNKPKLKVKYIKTEEYVNELIKNIQNGSDRNARMDKFRQKYRNVDVLLIDDIQFLESKTYTMEEIFHTFDSLHNNNKQIVITSDRLPKDIPTLPDRLRTRFEMGLVVDITVADFETRVAILKNLSDAVRLEIEFEVFEYIANNFVNNIRELEGAFNKVYAYSEIDGSKITLDFVKKVLNCDANQNKLSISIVAKAVGEHYGVSLNDFLSSAKNQRVSSARQVAVYLSRELTQKSFESIAKFFNKKHPTMLYSHEKIKTDLRTNKDLENNISEIKRKLKG